MAAVSPTDGNGKLAPVAITEHTSTRDGHTTFYLAAGPEKGPLLIFIHGWPELSISWRHQLPAFAAAGFRCIAPDMRGYGRSTVHSQHQDYAQGQVVADMVALHDSLDARPAVFIGHDWGCATVWSLAARYPERCLGVANLCVPYRTIELGLEHVISLVDRELYPEETFPAGQWEYMRFYEENFERATSLFEANVENTVKALFRAGDPNSVNQPAATAWTRQTNGWFGPLQAAPELPIDERVLSEAALAVYTAGLERNGFFGPNSYYMNHQRNASYSSSHPGNGILDMPVLFLHANFDTTCRTVGTRLADPMRQSCRRLTEGLIDSGHWMAQECPEEVNRALAHWLASSLGLAPSS